MAGGSYIATDNSVTDSRNTANASPVYSTVYTGEQVRAWFEEGKHIVPTYEKNEDGSYKTDANGKFIP